jgi:hypothetical protein
MEKYLVLMGACGTTNSVLSLSVITVGTVGYFSLVHSFRRYLLSILVK